MSVREAADRFPRMSVDAVAIVHRAEVPEGGKYGAPLRREVSGRAESAVMRGRPAGGNREVSSAWSPAR